MSGTCKHCGEVIITLECESYWVHNRTGMPACPGQIATPQTVTCEICSLVTSNVSKRCKRCYELERRIDTVSSDVVSTIIQQAIDKRGLVLKLSFPFPAVTHYGTISTNVADHVSINSNVTDRKITFEFGESIFKL